MRIKYLLVFVLFTFGIMTTLVYAEINPKNIVAYWNFDDGSGKIAKDGSGNALDGALVGNPKWVDGKMIKALEFNGMDDYVEVADINTPPILTFACWFKRTGAGNGGVPRLHSRGAGPWSLEFGVGNTHAPVAGQIGFYLAFADGGSTGWIPCFEAKENIWYHTAISYDGTWVRVYADGKEAYSGKDWAGKEINQGISRIGAHAAAGDCFQGIIDEVILLDVALSADDINSLMTGKWASVQPLDSAVSTWGKVKGD